MSKAKKTREAYKNLIKSSLTPQGFKNYKLIKIVILIFIACNYVAAFSDLYVILYSLVPETIHIFHSNIDPSIHGIKLEMSSMGDFSLLKKYTVFSIINFVVLFITILLTLFLIDGEIPKNTKFNLKLYFVFCTAITIFVLSVHLFTNEAGYNYSRFPMNAHLGRGVFFFIRDSGFIYCVAFLIVELTAMGHLLVKKN